MIREIVQEGNPVLRKRAQEVAINDITSPTFKKLVLDMIDTIHSEPLAAALAAPQIGESVRLFVVSDEIMKKATQGKSETPLVCFNPEIIKSSKDTTELHEGCLSFRGWWGYVNRYSKVTISYIDENGIEKERGASGFLAQVFQHEIDHLNGILYIDSADDMHTDAELKKRNKETKEERMAQKEVLDDTPLT